MSKSREEKSKIYAKYNMPAKKTLLFLLVPAKMKYTINKFS